MNISYPKTQRGLDLLLNEYRERWKMRGFSAKKIKRLVEEFKKRYGKNINR